MEEGGRGSEEGGVEVGRSREQRGGGDRRSKKVCSEAETPRTSSLVSLM